jgi:hypothetical protein
MSYATRDTRQFAASTPSVTVWPPSRLGPRGKRRSTSHFSQVSIRWRIPRASRAIRRSRRRCAAAELAHRPPLKYPGPSRPDRRERCCCGTQPSRHGRRHRPAFAGRARPRGRPGVSSFATMTASRIARAICILVHDFSSAFGSIRSSDDRLPAEGRTLPRWRCSMICVDPMDRSWRTPKPTTPRSPTRWGVTDTRMTRRHYAHLLDSVVAAELQAKLPTFNARRARTPYESVSLRPRLP